MAREKAIMTAPTNVKPRSLAARIGEKLMSPTEPNGFADIVARNEPRPTLTVDPPGGKWSDARGRPKLSRIIRKDKLPEFTGLERSAIEAMIEAGEFPRPIKLNDAGRSIGWLEEELVDWQQWRRALRDEGRNPVPKYRPVPPRLDSLKKRTAMRGK
jgi:predicted DNA-binding transcriptional regulator AlpA